MRDCLVCHAPLITGRRAWHQVCTCCGYEHGALNSAINIQTDHSPYDEAQRIEGLRSLRTENALRLLEILRAHTEDGVHRLLDVGCSHGWFLEAAANSFDVVGIEPDTVVAEQAIASGLPVRVGYFPAALQADERFDVIVFNDVIEHIPDLRTALAACHQCLTQTGLLLLNVPNSRGVFYRVAKSLDRLGVSRPFLRMWQFGYPSPHVHYFNADNLQTLLAGNGFCCVHTSTLKAVSRTGLWQRIRHVPGGLAASLFIYIILSVTLPVFDLFPRDSLVGLFRKKP